MNRLHVYCLANIFSHLSIEKRINMEKVCKKWKEAVAISWHSVKKLDTDNLQILIQKKESTLKELLNNCCKYLTHLTIDYQYSWMTDVLKNNCENIVFFDINLCSEYSHSLCEIIGSMNKLKCLKAAVNNSDICYNLVIKLVNILPAKMNEIHLFQVESQNPEPMESQKIAPVLDKFINLRCLTLHYFSLTTATIKTILQNKNFLIYLDLKDCHFPEECPITLFTKLVNLEHIKLGGDSFKYKNDIISEIAQNSQKLKYLCVIYSDGIYIPYKIFSDLQYLKNLEYIETSPVNESSDDDDEDIHFMPNLVENWTKLKYLNVGKGENFSMKDIDEIAKIKNLDFLDLSTLEEEEEQLLSKKIMKIASNCLNLKELKVKLETLPDTVFQTLTNLKKIEKLNFQKCENLTGNTLTEIANKCKYLVDLNLGECKNVTEDSLMQVGKLEYLKKLDVGGIPVVPNAMFDDFHNLEYLVCTSRCVTDEGIIKVLDNCRQLFYLCVWNTKITIRTINHALKRKFVFKKLVIHVDDFIKNEYTNSSPTSSPYLTIKNSKESF